LRLPSRPGGCDVSPGGQADGQNGHIKSVSQLNIEIKTNLNYETKAHALQKVGKASRRAAGVVLLRGKLAAVE
jgi:hypothetical protein